MEELMTRGQTNLNIRRIRHIRHIRRTRPDRLSLLCPLTLVLLVSAEPKLVGTLPRAPEF